MIHHLLPDDIAQVTGFILAVTRALTSSLNWRRRVAGGVACFHLDHPAEIMTLKTIYIARHGFRLNWHTKVW
jgi:hypothetical protein